ncbi:MAG: SWIM zinc finger domain-containing protein [Desulfurococcaceae archaeon]|nr:SWIM zinc finger domain-containing protein [Desulfurococcaceae archaeon]
METPNPLGPTPQVGALLLRWVSALVQVRPGPGFKPVSSWYARRYPREEPGVLAKAVALTKDVRVVRVSDVAVEAEVPSETNPSKTYRVKVYLYPLDFECTCPYSEHHFNPCKHVLAVVLRLIAEPITRDFESFYYRTLTGRQLASAVHYALCVHAYMKAEQHTRV